LTLIAVFRRVPPPIIGTCGVTHDRRFEAFEEELDWIEAAGTPVERFDPDRTPAEVDRRESVKELLLAQGDRCLPLVVAGDQIVSQGVYLTRTRLAHLVACVRQADAPDSGATAGDAPHG